MDTGMVRMRLVLRHLDIIRLAYLWTRCYGHVASQSHIIHASMNSRKTVTALFEKHCVEGKYTVWQLIAGCVRKENNSMENGWVGWWLACWLTGWLRWWWTKQRPEWCNSTRKLYETLRSNVKLNSLRASCLIVVSPLDCCSRCSDGVMICCSPIAQCYAHASKARVHKWFLLILLVLECDCA